MHVNYLKLFHLTFEFINDIISPIICKHLYVYLTFRLTLRKTPCYTMQNYLFLNKVLLVIHKSVILVPLVMSANSPILLMSLLFKIPHKHFHIRLMRVLKHASFYNTWVVLCDHAGCIMIHVHVNRSHAYQLSPNNKPLIMQRADGRDVCRFY